MENTIGEAIANQVADQAKAATANASVGFMERTSNAYGSFIGMFPEEYQWVVSLLLALAIAAFLWNLVKKNWLWLVLLLILFPGILPILKNIFDSLTALFTGNSQNS